MDEDRFSLLYYCYKAGLHHHVPSTQAAFVRAICLLVVDCDGAFDLLRSFPAEHSALQQLEELCLNSW